MGLAAYMEQTSEGVAPKYQLPVTEEEKIVCHWCEMEVSIVISLGALWVCESCYDEAKEAWNGIKKGGKK